MLHAATTQLVLVGTGCVRVVLSTARLSFLPDKEVLAIEFAPNSLEHLFFDV